MSTRHDRNFRSWDGGGDDPPNSDLILDPEGAGWLRGSWADTAKFHKRVGEVYHTIRVMLGGAEDCVDISPETCDCEFRHFDVQSGGDYVLTLKGGSCHNVLAYWTIRQGGRVVDIEIGNWSSSNFERSTGNEFVGWYRNDGLPVTYCYRLGCRPKFTAMRTRHLWWRSLGLTAYWWGKFIWHRVLRRPDV